MAADQLDIDLREQPAIEQRAVLVALRQIDAVAVAERVEGVRRARMPPPGERQRIDDAVPPQHGSATRSSSALRKPKSKAALCMTSIAAVDEGQQIVGELAEARLVGEELEGQAVHRVRGGGHVGAPD